MNREIKFRAWYQPKDGRFLKPEMLEMSTDTSSTPRFWSTQGHMMTFNFFDLDLVLMRVTGLKDIDGKEIYESDIVEWSIFPDEESPKRIRDVVGFSLECFKAEKRNEILGLKEPHRGLKVIGNIYENPELLN